MSSLLRSAILVLVIALGAACASVPGVQPTPAGPSKPTVIINSPVSNATVQAGAPVSVQSTSNDLAGIVLVELLVDGKSVQISPTPNGQPQTQFAVIQTWQNPEPGTHTVTVKATNSRAVTSEAGITLNVSGAIAQATATSVAVIPTATRLAPTGVPPPAQPTPVIPTAIPPTSAPATCTLNARFVADVTIPDGTVIAPGGQFVKTWAVQNNGTCAWDAGYNLIFVGGEQFGAGSPQAIPPAQPGQTVNISVGMAAPFTPGQRSSVWQIRASNGALFGTRLDAVIVVPGAPTPIPPTPIPAGCTGAPFFSGLSANPPNIVQGQSTTLSWGLVQNANAVTLTTPSGTQGVATPGSISVKPNQTTTYTLTARCGNNQVAISVTVNVSGQQVCNGRPRFNGLTANPTNIQRGQSAVLNWGLVTNATQVVLQTPDGNSGVATPGQLRVSPRRTTTYTLIAYCFNRTEQLSVTVNVQNVPAPTPTPVGQPNQIRSVKAEKIKAATWKITVQYYWNGEAKPAVIEGYGTNSNNRKITNTDSAAIIAGFVKFVILELEVTPGKGALQDVQVCMVGRGDSELVCRTTRAQ